MSEDQLGGSQECQNQFARRFLFEKGQDLQIPLCLRSHHMERMGTRSVAICVIRGFLGFFSTSTLNLTL